MCYVLPHLKNREYVLLVMFKCMPRNNHQPTLQNIDFFVIAREEGRFVWPTYMTVVVKAPILTYTSEHNLIPSTISSQ
jgi:hypothetical protein